MRSPKTKRNLSRIIPFGLIWLIFGLIYSLLERGLLGDLANYPSTGNPYNFRNTMVVTAISAFLSGLLVGTLEVLYFYKLFQRRSFVRKFVYKTGIYLAIIISFLLINTLIFNAVELKTGIFSRSVWNNIWSFFSDYAFWSVCIYMAAIIGVSLFYIEVGDNLGQPVLNNFFTGKYHAPVEEERIFMFLDMKASTTIAERIGHCQYFEMLNEYFSDLSDPIVLHLGEIYQYVGDEIVVSWTLEKGLRHNNCIQCFFAMKEAIQRQVGKYSERFGLLPDFKAGFHVGKVTTGEIGVIKKDIIFTGDVLNTTSRVQGLCNTYEVDLLISDELLRRLQLPAQFQVKALGENELRGRDEKIKLFTISRKRR